jgi:lipopolysaccharide transport system ATP-binding protein
MSALIVGKDIVVDFPIYGTRSLKNTLMSGVTGGLIKKAGKNTVVRALDSINFEFNRGDKIGLWGHNGSGKTTMLRLLSKVYVPTSGTIFIGGNVTSLLSVSLGMEMEATGLENIFLRGTVMGLSDKLIKQKIDEIVEFSELGDYIKLPYKTYSTGMQMRLAFSVSTCVTSDVLLMDEWLGVGDEQFVTKATARLNDMLKASEVLVLASHDKMLLERNCTRILHMDHGHIVDDFRVS